MELVEVHDPGEDAHELIARHLRASNRRNMPRLEAAFEHAWFLKNEAGEVMGGLWAEKTMDWVFVEKLFVPEALRGQGVGSDLLARVETRAREWQAYGLWLDTFGFQARGFYERYGYLCFGTLEGATPEADQHFMRKTFS